MSAWSLASGALSTIGNIYSTQLNNAHQERLQQQAQEWNANQATIAWNRSVEQWNRENEYNSPVEQMKRLREAGINPALAYASGVFNQAGNSPEAPVSAPAKAANTQAWQVDPLTMAQIGLIQAQIRKTQSETSYQDYLNKVEEALAHSPMGHVRVVAPDGSESVELVYGNARVEFARKELEALGLENGLNKVTLNDLIYNLAVLTGDDGFPLSDFNTIAPSSLPGYEEAVAALRGDQRVRYLSGELANLSYEASNAEKAGRQAYADWIKKHGDEPVVKFMLTLQGFLQTLGISLPSFSGSRTVQGHYDANSHYVPRTTRSFFFGGRR